MEIELEKTFLVRKLPDLKNAKVNELLDIYIPTIAEHPCLRVREKSGEYTITKKQPVHGKDSSEQVEQTIPLTLDEFKEFSILSGKRVHKKRYTQQFGKITMDLDIFLDGLSGLVLVDFEFTEKEEKDLFKMPDWCLADVTQEKFIAGGVLAGKVYADVEQNLFNYGYKKIDASTL